MARAVVNCARPFGCRVELSFPGLDSDIVLADVTSQSLRERRLICIKLEDAFLTDTATRRLRPVVQVLCRRRRRRLVGEQNKTLNCNLSC